MAWLWELGYAFGLAVVKGFLKKEWIGGFVALLVRLYIYSPCKRRVEILALMVIY